MKKPVKILLYVLIGLAWLALVGFVMWLILREPAPGPGPEISAAESAADPTDESRAREVTEIDIFSLNDLHGKVADGNGQPGVDELTTYLATKGKNTVILSSGDMWQGSSESNLTAGNLVTEWMNGVGFDAMALGNHEFDWGTPAVYGNAELATFPMLAINVYDRDTNERIACCDASAMIERDGVKIGIIGAISDCYSSIASDRSGDFFFVTGYRLTQLIREEAKALREKGADLVILSIHGGYGSSLAGKPVLKSGYISDYYDASLSNGSIDLVFEAHTHMSYTFLDTNGVWHLQAGGENKGISHVKLLFDKTSGSFEVKTAEIVPNSIYGQCEPASLYKDICDRYADIIALGDAYLGMNPVQRSSEYMQGLVSELYYQFGEKIWGDRYDIFLGGGFLKARSPYNLPSGPISYSDLQMLFPFDNQLVLCSISGRDLRSQFLETSNENYFVCLGEFGQKALDYLDPDGTYYIVIDSYSSTYKPNRCTEIERYPEGLYARDLLANYYAGRPLDTPVDKEIGGKFTYTLTSVREVLAIGAKLDENGKTPEDYFVKGKIVSVENTTYGNVWIEDENGDRLYIYGIYDSKTNTRFDKMNPRPKAGDTVILYGQVQRYVSASGSETIELSPAKLVKE